LNLDIEGLFGHYVGPDRCMMPSLMDY
jgi:hypothetical protein